jgi:hypothetical protein
LGVAIHVSPEGAATVPLIVPPAIVWPAGAVKIHSGPLADVPDALFDGGECASLRARIDVAAPARLISVEPPAGPAVGRRRLAVGLRARRQRPRACVRGRRRQGARLRDEDDQDDD